MNRIMKKILIILIILFGLIMIKVNAATVGSFSVSPSSKELEIGETLTVTITTKNCAGQFTISSSDSKIVSISESSKWVEGTETVTLTAKAKGTATITIKAENVGDNQADPEDVTGSKTVAVTVKEKEQKPATPQTPTTPVVTEPKFTDTNKTMYATGDINLRSSWSTSSAATAITKGTELKVTGTSTEKVNGYVWYRVSYNGATKYVASNLLTNTKPEEEKKSDNAYLKSLTIEGQELIPTFNKETTSYTMQVTSDIIELNVKAETEDEKASTSIQGNKDLKDGENIVTISVNAEDGTTKIYEIKVTKSEKIALGLKSLIIEGTDIESDFRPELYEYEIEVEDVTNLQIEAIANDETATVEILGNEDLQDGENIITIIVSSQDGKEKVTYQITANKIAKKTSTVEKKTQIVPKVYLYIALGVVVLIALIIVIVYTIRHRNTDEYDFSDNFDGFSKELPEKNEGNILFSDNNKEETKEVDISNEEPENSDEIDKIREDTIEDKKAKIDYAVDDEEENEKPRRKKGKHF